MELGLFLPITYLHLSPFSRAGHTLCWRGWKILPLGFLGSLKNFLWPYIWSHPKLFYLSSEEKKSVDHRNFRKLWLSALIMTLKGQFCVYKGYRNLGTGFWPEKQYTKQLHVPWFQRWNSAEWWTLRIKRSQTMISKESHLLLYHPNLEVCLNKYSLNEFCINVLISGIFKTAF